MTIKATTKGAVYALYLKPNSHHLEGDERYIGVMNPGYLTGNIGIFSGGPSKYKGWMVSHNPSGRIFFECAGKRQALNIIAELRGQFDLDAILDRWADDTASHEDYLKTREIRDLIKERGGR